MTWDFLDCDLPILRRRPRISPKQKLAQANMAWKSSIRKAKRINATHEVRRRRILLQTAKDHGWSNFDG